MKNTNNEETTSKDVLLVIVALLFTTSICYITYIHATKFFEGFQRDFLLVLFVEGVGLAIIYFTGYELMKWSYERSNKKFNPWMAHTSFTILVVTIAGMAIIPVMIGEPADELKLRNNQGEVVGTIKCQDVTGKFLIGGNFKCKLTPELTNISANVSFILYNGAKTKQRFDNLTFIAPADVNRIEFELEGISNEGQSTRLTTGWYVSYYTQDQSKERDEKRIAYFITFLGILFVSIPTAFSSWKYLYNQQSI